MPRKKKKPKINVKTKHLLDQQTHPHAAGIDIGAEELVVAISPDLDDRPVRTFDSFTADLKALCDWLISHGITTVAMESTGSYWIPSYDHLEAAGIKVCLVNARHVKGVPGKKTDVCDAQWLQQLHTAGLLKASFRPELQVVAVRQLVRHRSNMIKDASRHLLHMQKALTEMNVKLHHVFSDLDGESAMRIVEAILDGQRDPGALWLLRNKRCRTDRVTFEKAIQGDWQESLLFILRQSHARWKQTRESITVCDAEVEKRMGSLESETNEALPHAPVAQRRQRKNDLTFDLHAEAYRCYGVDLAGIDGISGGTLTVMLSELGNAKQILGSFKNAKVFSSWLGLCPDNRISGGKLLTSKTRRVVNRVSEALRLAAMALTHSKSELGRYCRRMKGRLGKAEGTTAVAHKLARVIYALLESKEPYDEAKAFQMTAQAKARKVKNLYKMAKSLNMKLTPEQAVS